MRAVARRFAVSVSVVSRAWRRYQETGQYIRRHVEEAIGGQQPSSRTGFMGVCPTSPHVLCGSGEGIRPCPSWYSVGSAPCEYGVRGPLLRAVRSLYDRSRSLVRIAGRFLGIARGQEGVRFGNHRISSLLFADDVVLLASSSQDLQHVLERFAAECEAAGMRISTSKCPRPWSSTGKGWRALSQGGWRGPASSGGVQVSRGLVHE
ncbi:hypothetical protein L3Q82_023017 [Scortum barcoo]|uniref:Uncharacterized protein n=1 Tax=Scortum barcoo TaxID=214431 RepID=A0ACB8WYZ4_9TELE|nr:hypothetical protein L3Q82_023017 [Scortum barcoo]